MRPLRLLLIDPPFYRLYKDSYGLCKLPLGAASLAAWAERHLDIEVRVLNADFHPAPEQFSVPFMASEGFAAYRRALAGDGHPVFGAVADAVQRFEPDVVGITVRTPALASARIVARIVKRLNPEIFVLAGGPHPSLTGEAMLGLPEFDAAVAGEGEQTLCGFFSGFACGQIPKSEPGLILRRGDAAKAAPPRAPLENLDLLPFPASIRPETLIDRQAYPLKAFGYVFASRGCPRRCGYCSSHGVWGDGVRLRSNASILEELGQLAGQGVTHVHFDDDTFGVTKPRLISLCRALEAAGMGLSYSCETHVSLIDETTAQALARAGFATVQLGIESGDDAMLAAVGKGFTVRRAERAAGLIKAAGMRLEAFFMAGFPEETIETLAATRSLMERLPCDKIIYSIFTPYPGTPLFERCASFGLIGPDFDPSRHNHQSPENAFCPRITPKRFRELAGEIERLVAQRNVATR